MTATKKKPHVTVARLALAAVRAPKEDNVSTALESLEEAENALDQLVGRAVIALVDTDDGGSDTTRDLMALTRYAKDLTNSLRAAVCVLEAERASKAPGK